MNSVKKKTVKLEELRKRDLDFANDITCFSSSIPFSLYTDTTAVKTPESCYRGVPFSSNRLLGEQYLLNFRKGLFGLDMLHGINAYHSKAVRSALSHRHTIEEALRSESPETVIELPPPRKISMSLHSAVTRRRSVRSWPGKPFSISHLSTILFHAQGITGEFDVSPESDPLAETILYGNNHRAKCRTTPSAGGLYPIDLYCICSNMIDIATGVYRFLPESHSLVTIDVFDDMTATRISGVSESTDFDTGQIRVQIVFCYKLYGNSRKYGDTGMAFAFIEAGEIAQNIHLAATALGCGPCDIGGYDKSSLEKACGVDGLSTHVIHHVVIGS